MNDAMSGSEVVGPTEKSSGNAPTDGRPATIAPAPRLLVALRPSEELDAALRRALPDIPYGYASAVAPEARSEVEALLVGSVERELGAFDPASFPRLQFVQRAYTGLDGFPFHLFPPPIQVAGNVGGFAPFVAEGAVALALASSHSLIASHRMIAEGRLRPPPPASTFRGKTALLLGYGSIGREIALRLAGFGMRVVGLNRSGRMAPGVDAMYPADRLDEALAIADVVFEMRPLTRFTRESIGPAQLAAMRPEAIFVNVGRAGTVQEEALYRHVQQHPGFRVALDVWWDEGFGDGRLGQKFAWTDLANVTGSPHSSGAVPEAGPYGMSRVLENLHRFFRGEAPQYIADPSDYTVMSGGADVVQGAGAEPADGRPRSNPSNGVNASASTGTKSQRPSKDFDRGDGTA
jgi:phosphoglycerate dehydrogenase-like enzyme